MKMTVTEFINAAAHNRIMQLVILAIVFDTIFAMLYISRCLAGVQVIKVSYNSLSK